MKQVGGVWLPDHEQHLVEWMMNPKNKKLVDGKLAYQWTKQCMAMEHVRNWRTAIDIGAHCGLWSMHLAKRFQALHAFEPVEEHRACWVENMRENVEAAVAVGRERAFLIYPYALGEKEGSVRIETRHTSSGDSFVAGEGDIPMKRLDDFDFSDVDFMKLDCEGYELFILRGAEETIKRWQPTIIVEQKPNRAVNFGLPQTGAVEYLKSLGATLRAERSGDYVFSW